MPFVRPGASLKGSYSRSYLKIWKQSDVCETIKASDCRVWPHTLSKLHGVKKHASIGICCAKIGKPGQNPFTWWSRFTDSSGINRVTILTDLILSLGLGILKPDRHATHENVIRRQCVGPLFAGQANLSFTGYCSARMSRAGSPGTSALHYITYFRLML
jgi:hypothetical protein